MEHFLNPDVTTYAGMITVGCVILAIGFFVGFVQSLRKKQPNWVHLLMAIAAGVIASRVFITADVMRDHMTQQNNGTPFVLWLLGEAALISLGMAGFYFKKSLGMTIVCTTPVCAVMALFAAYLAASIAQPWVMVLFDVLKYVALTPLVLAAVLRMVYPRRWRALPRQ